MQHCGTLRAGYASAVPTVLQQTEGLRHNTPQKLMGQPPGVHCPVETRDTFHQQGSKGEQTTEMLSSGLCMYSGTCTCMYTLKHNKTGLVSGPSG